MKSAQLFEETSRLVQFAASGAAVGNLTTGKGELCGHTLRIAFMENRIAGGSFGAAECKVLGKFLHDAASDHVLLCLDSAGARVSEGLPALGAFRSMFADALDLALSGTPILAVLGRHCFGGASMLAHLAGMRIFCDDTQLAMSGPAILAAAAGFDGRGDALSAWSGTVIGTQQRCGVTSDNIPAADVPSLRDTLAHVLNRPAVDDDLRRRHAELGRRIGAEADALSTMRVERFEMPDVAALFPQGYSLKAFNGIVTGEGMRMGKHHNVLGYLGGPLTAAHAWMLADIAWHMSGSDRPCLLLLGCDSHSVSIEDEKPILSEYIASLSLALARLGRSRVSTVILGKAGGGVYVAFAAAASHVLLDHEANVQLLPGSAMERILGTHTSVKFAASDFLASGVADEEIHVSRRQQ